MVELDYGTLLAPYPIKLSIGTLLKPKLSEIYDLSFDRFAMYESLTKMTPEVYYTEVLRTNGGEEKWNSFDENTKSSIQLFDIIATDKALQDTYCDVLNFFFDEHVVYLEGAFILFDSDYDINNKTENIKDHIVGVIHNSELFQQVLDIIQQTCCIYEKPEESEDTEIKFKSNLARKIFEKMRNAKKEQRKQKAKQENKDYSLPNLISAVSNKHLCLSPINVWDLTVYPLVDSFNRLRTNAIYDINSLRVSVWGDEKKQFDETLWYKYKHDEKEN